MSPPAEIYATLPPDAVAMQQQLELAFGSSFAIWSPSPSGWICQDNRDSLAASPAEPELAAWFDRLLLDSPALPQVARLAGDKTFAAAVYRAESAETWVVCGLIESDFQLLAANLAASAVQHVIKQADRVANQELLDCYAERLTQSFEEATFLRRLSRHIEFCDARRLMEDVARTILPQLYELLRVEAVCLIDIVTDPDSDQPIPGRVLQAYGSPVGTGDVWRRLIAEMGNGSKQVTIRNYFGICDLGCPPIPELRSIVLAPIVSNGELFGWLLGINRRPDENTVAHQLLGDDQIGSMEASLLEAAGLMLGSQASNSRHFREKEAFIVDVIHTLVGVIEAKDAYTCGHSDRVALIGRRLGEEMGLPANECHEIYLAGLLHDIGKVGIADDVLLKPGKLSDEEFALIKRHPQIGADLLQRLKPLANLIPGVLHQHEACDGSGYPHGLIGNQIPKMACILAVADAFDAMTSKRPYRDGMPLAKANAILQAGAGKQWNANVVAAHFAAQDDIVQIGNHWQEHLTQILQQRDHASEEQTAVGAAAFLGAAWSATDDPTALMPMASFAPQ